MPQDAFHDPVDVLLELPRQATLADAALAGDRHEPEAPLAGRRVEEVLQEPKLRIAADEGCLEPVAPPDAAPLGDHPEGAPGGDRRRLALQELLAGLLVGDGPGRGSMGHFPDEHDARWGHGLEATRGIDDVTGDHALASRPERDRRLAGDDARPRLEAREEPADGVDDVERGANRALRIVLVRRGRTPDRHDGVADELLDGAAVALDHVAGDVEVPAQELANLLVVAALGQGRESDQVGEEDRDEAALGHGRGPGRSDLAPGLGSGGFGGNP